MLEEFDNPVIRTFARPFCKYDEILPAELLILLLESRLFEMQVYLMLLHRSGLNLPISLRAWQLDSRNFRLIDMPEIYGKCQDDLLVQLMFFLKIQRDHMLKELEGRFKEKPIGMAVLMDRWQDDVGDRWIRKQRLIVEKDPESRNDIRQAGLCEGLEFLDEAGKDSTKQFSQFLALPPPEFPFARDDFERLAWDALVQDIWRSSLQEICAKVVPLVDGVAEKASRAVDNFLRASSLQAQRRKKILEGHLDEVGRNITAKVMNPEESLERKLLDERAYKIAERRHGLKGRIFIDSLKAGKTRQEAAADAGFNEKTGRRLINQIREKLPKPSQK